MIAKFSHARVFNSQASEAGASPNYLCGDIDMHIPIEESNT